MSKLQQHHSGAEQRQSEPLTGRFYPTQNYLSEGVRKSSVGLLNQTLADTTVLQTHAQAAHWNVKGPNFFSLHELFEEIYEDLAEHADEIAERVTALGGEAKGTTRIAGANSRIPGLPDGAVTGQEYVQLLAERLAIHDAHLAEGIRMASRQDDLDTADLLNEVSREITKDLWFLEAHLQTRPITGPGESPGGQYQQGQGFQQPQGEQGVGGAQGSGQPPGSMGQQPPQSMDQQPQSVGQQPARSMGEQSARPTGQQPPQSMGQQGMQPTTRRQW